jgi:hypothetical protein
MQRSSIFFPSESAEERLKREKRSLDVHQLLSPTHQYHSKLSNRVTDLKSYMDQEFESGIRTMEMLMVRELHQKTKQLQRLSKELQHREEAINSDAEVIQLKQEIDKYRERKQGLSALTADLTNAEDLYKLTLRKLREITRKEGEELKALLKENYLMESRVARGYVAWSRPVDSSGDMTERLKAALPPLSLLFELSPRSIGNMKLDEIHGYKSIRERLYSMKDLVKSRKREVHSMKSRQVATTEVPLALERLYDEGLASLLQSLPRSLSLSSPSLRSPKSSVSSNKVSLAMLGLACRRDLVTSLRQKVFPSSVLGLCAAPSPVLSL